MHGYKWPINCTRTRTYRRPMSLGVELDPSADYLGDRNYRLENGILHETEHTLQCVSIQYT